MRMYGVVARNQAQLDGFIFSFKNCLITFQNSLCPINFHLDYFLILFLDIGINIDPLFINSGFFQVLLSYQNIASKIGKIFSSFFSGFSIQTVAKLSMFYGYSRPYVYHFCQIFHDLCLLLFIPESRVCQDFY